jgi:hypothetical protein
MASADREIQDHLRAASDAILLLVGQIAQLEQHKRGVTPGEPRFDELAEQVRQAAQDLAEFARGEEAWARGALASEGPFDTISASPNPEPLSDILARWRAVERQLDGAAPGSPEAESLFIEFNRLRDEYLAAFQARRGDQGAER